VSDAKRLRIGELAELTGTTPRTVRYYEEIGLLPTVGGREQGKRRHYGESDVERLREIMRLRDLLGLSLDELRSLVEAQDARAALRKELYATDDAVRQAEILGEALEHISNQLKLVRNHKRELERLERELTAKQRKARARLRDLDAEGAAA
jgi:MerR family transcriptional regulator, repressor of the yfmOP operon